MMHKSSTLLFRTATLHHHHLLSRSFSTSAATHSRSSPLPFTRSDLAEYPELDRSFMRVLDSGVDTQSADYQDNYR